MPHQNQIDFSPNNLDLRLERISPDEKKWEISYSLAEGPFGQMLVASTVKGLCYLGLVVKDEFLAVADLKRRHPDAHFVKRTTTMHQQVSLFFTQTSEKALQITLHLKGTDFQFQVWNALIKIPVGTRISYGALAKSIDHPKAYRAVGTAVGQNPIFFLIPCHRVVPTIGGLGNYYWGKAIKATLIEWEEAYFNRLAKV